MKKISELPFNLKFYIIAGILLFAVALFFAYFSRSFVIKDAREGMVHHAQAHAAELELAYSKSPDGPPHQKWHDIRDTWTSKAHNIIDSNLWLADGTVKFAVNDSSENRRFSLPDRIKKAFKGEVVSGINNLNEPIDSLNKKKFNDLFEIFIPIKVNDRIVAVQEINFGTTQMYASIAEKSRVIYLSSASAFLLLFLILSGLVRNASRKINRQKISLEEALDTLNNHFLATIESFNVALESRDKYTGGHSERVSNLAISIGKSMNLSKNDLEALRIGGLFHDIGKIGIPDEVLLKPARLTNSEFDQIKQHPVIGHRITAALPTIAKSLAIIRNHHERWDGSGYPDSFKGDATDLLARITAYADCYDALRSDRPYRLALDHATAMSIIDDMIGSHLDPTIAPIALSCLTEMNRTGNTEKSNREFSFAQS